MIPGIVFRVFSENDIDRAKVEAYQQGLAIKRGELLAAVNDLINANTKALEDKKAAHAEALANCREDEVESLKKSQAEELAALEKEQEDALYTLRAENQKKLDAYRSENGLALDGIGIEVTTDDAGYVAESSSFHTLLCCRV